jgi:hypothetical protein
MVICCLRFRDDVLGTLRNAVDKLDVSLTKNALQFFSERPFISEFAFPNDKHLPAQCSERRSFLGVSGDVLSKLFLPEAYSSAWRTGGAAATMSMPETAMDQDNAAKRR